MQIRDITASDKNTWSRMRTQLWPDTDDQHQAEIQEFFDGIAADIVKVLIVENSFQQACGFIELNIRNFAEGSKQAAVPYVEGWYVDKAFRNNGYGSALMRAAEQWALDSGYHELASDTEWDNLYSQKLHKAFGFQEVEKVVCLLKKLP